MKKILTGRTTFRKDNMDSLKRVSRKNKVADQKKIDTATFIQDYTYYDKNL